jgi:hypothetical protein
MAIIRGGGHAVVEHRGAADVVLVDGDSIDQYGPPVVTLGGADTRLGCLNFSPRRRHGRNSRSGVSQLQ